MPDLMEQSTDNLERGGATAGQRRLFVMLLAIGLILRIVAGVYSQGLAVTDEHQQYLEQAHRMLYGCGQQYWEQDRGMRHVLFQGLLAAGLYLLECLHVSNPLVQAAALRSVLGLAVFGSIALFAWQQFKKESPLAGLFLLGWSALSPDMIFISVRTLGETAMIVPLLLAWIALPRSPFWAGILLELMFGIRFQSGFLITGFAFLGVYDGFKSNDSAGRNHAFRLLAGLVVGLIVVGGIDKWYYGDWWHSPFAYFRANIIEHAAARFGVEPWHLYLRQVGERLFQGSIFGPFLLFVGMYRQPRLAFLALLFLIGHSAVGHKEFRFLWGVSPLVGVFLASGVDAVCTRADVMGRKKETLAIILLTFVVGMGIRGRKIEWNREPFCSSAVALANVGRQPDVTGVAVYGVATSQCGNYFYLRQCVPLLTEDRAEPDITSFLSHSEWTTHQISHLITPEIYAPLFAAWHPQEIDRRDGLVTYRLTHADTDR